MTILAVLVSNQFAYAQSDIAPKAQWNFQGSRPVSGSNDWVFDVLPTDKYEYIVCGYTSAAGVSNFVPVIFKLDNMGRILWSQTIDNTFTSNGLSTDKSKSGIYYQAIATPNGYAVVGYKDVTTPGANRCALITELDNDGNIINHRLYLIPNFANAFRTESIAMSPDNSHLFISGYAKATPTSQNYGAVAKIDYASGAMVGHYTAIGTGSGNCMLSRLKICMVGAGYQVLATGYQSINDPLTYNDNVTVKGNNSDNSQVTLTKKNKDIWVIGLDQNLSATPVFSTLFDKSDLGAIHYTEAGPATARTINGSYPSPVMQHLQASLNHDERGTDIILTNDGNIAVSAIINRIAIWGYGDDNGETIYEDAASSPGTITDPVRNLSYEIYGDGDAYILKLNPSNGSMIWNKNVGHFSSADFFVKLIQLDCGDYVIAGSSADYNLNIAHYDASITGVADNSTAGHQWKRYFTAEDKEAEICNFALAKTFDGGFVTGGDNLNNGDDFSVTKFGSPEVPNADFDLDPGVYMVGSVGTIENWPNSTVPVNGKIAAKVVVPAGKTLQISGCNLQFAPSDHLSDYYDYQLSTGNQCGIVVEKGGKLIISNSTLTGLSTTCDTFMWDGISIKGDPATAQTPANQGTVEIFNSTIEQAKVGLITGIGQRKYMDGQNFPPPADYTAFNGCTRYMEDTWEGGAIATIKNTQFLNCRFSANFYAYPNPGLGLTTANPIFLEGNNFQSNAVLKDMYLYSDRNGRRLSTNSHLKLIGVEKVTVWDNQFTAHSSFDKDIRPLGIVGYDLGGAITRHCTYVSTQNPCEDPGPGNTFTNLNQGINIFYTPQYAALPLEISFNTFDENSEAISLATNYFGLVVTDNQINIPPQHIDINGTPLNAFGLRLVGNYGYKVTNNHFDKCGTCSSWSPETIGVLAVNGHDDPAEVYRNDFNNLQNPALSLHRNGSNPFGLEWICNDFLSGCQYSIRRSSFDASSGSIAQPTLRYAQGDFALSTDINFLTAAAGNRFYNICTGNANRLNSYNFGYLGPYQQVIYYNNQSNTVYDPEYNGTNCISADWTNISLNTGVDSSTSRSVPCPGGYLYEENLAQEMTQLQSSISLAQNSNDTAAIQTAMYHLSAEQAKRYAKAGDYDSAALLMENRGQRIPAFIYRLLDGDTTDAAAQLALLPATHPLKPALTQALNLHKQHKRAYGAEADTAIINTLLAMQDVARYTGLSLAHAAKDCHLLWPIPGFPTLTNQARQQVWPPDKEQIQSLLLYPNPTQGEVTVDSKEGGLLRIYNTMGTIVYSSQILRGSVQLHLGTNLSSGIYFVHLTTAMGKVHAAKLILN